MIDINLKFQAILFGSYEDITPNPDILKYFMDKFSTKGLIPTTFQEAGINGIVNRFSLASSDGVWMIQFGTNRIDIHKINSNIGVTEIGEIEQFIQESKEIASIIDEKFPKKHNRLSINSRYLLSQMDEKTMSDIYKKLNKTIELYQKNNIVEWSTRTVSRVPYTIGGNAELFNIISHIKRTTGTHSFDSKIEKIDRLELHFDLNTYQGNTDYRFNNESFNQFLDIVSNVESELKVGYVNLIKL